MALVDYVRTCFTQGILIEIQMGYNPFMTFEELNKLIVAIRARKVSYDFFTRKVEMIITPEYGVKEEVNGKTFKLVFKDCVYISVRGLREYDDLGMEFISWGKLENKNITTELVNIRSEIGGFDKFSSRIGENMGDYDTYFFENVFGSMLYITCWTVAVNEIENY